MAAADPAAAAAGADDDANEAEDAELAAAVVAATQTASQQAAGEAQPAAAPSEAAADEASQEKLYLYTFQQHPQYRNISSGHGRRQQQRQVMDAHCSTGTADGAQPSVVQQGQEQQQQQRHAGQQPGSSESVVETHAVPEQGLQGIAATPGDMLLLSADGLQVRGHDACQEWDRDTWLSCHF